MTDRDAARKVKLVLKMICNDDAVPFLDEAKELCKKTRHKAVINSLD